MVDYLVGSELVVEVYIPSSGKLLGTFVGVDVLHVQLWGELLAVVESKEFQTCAAILETGLAVIWSR